MRLTRHERQIWIAAFAAALGAIVNKGRMKTAGAAHRAREYADASVVEMRIARAAK